MATLSNRTFGVELETFFTQTGWDKLKTDNPEITESVDEQKKKYEAEPGFESDSINLGYNLSIFDKLFLGKVLRKYNFSKWKIVSDNSIKGEGMVVAAEFVSSILSGPSGLKEVLRFVKFIKKYASVNTSTGLHVHIGVPELNHAETRAEKLTTILLKYGSIEPVFDKLVMSQRKKNESMYAGQTDTLEEIISNYRIVVKKELQDLNSILAHLQDTRYKKLNLLSLIKHGTIEFRQLHGTLNEELIKNWIIICLSFVDEVVKIDQTFVKLLLDIKKKAFENPSAFSPYILPKEEDFKNKKIDFDKDTIKRVTDVVITEIKNELYRLFAKKEYNSFFKGSSFTLPFNFYNGLVQIGIKPIKINDLYYTSAFYPAATLHNFFNDNMSIEEKNNFLNTVVLPNVVNNSGLKGKIKAQIINPSNKSSIYIQMNPLLIYDFESAYMKEKIKTLLQPETQALKEPISSFKPNLPQRNIAKAEKLTAASPMFEIYKSILNQK